MHLPQRITPEIFSAILTSAPFIHNDDFQQDLQTQSSPNIGSIYRPTNRRHRIREEW